MSSLTQVRLAKYLCQREPKPRDYMDEDYLICYNGLNMYMQMMAVGEEIHAHWKAGNSSIFHAWKISLILADSE